MSRILFVLSVLASLLPAAHADDRFSLKHARVAAATAADGARFSVHASAEIHESLRNPPRFAMKRVLADCAPLPDPLFANSFE